MANLHGLSNNVGMFMILVGMIMSFPIFTLIVIISVPDIWDFVIEKTGWNSWLIIGIVFLVCVPTMVMWFAYAFDMVKSRDKKVDEIKSIKEKSEDSKHKPEPPKES